MRFELNGVPKSQKMSVASSVVLAPRCLPTAMEKSTRRRLPTAMEEGNKDELRRIAKATEKFPGQVVLPKACSIPKGL
jgi:hypothetical protein